MRHIAIVDFGSQYTHVIARAVRDAGVLSRIYPHDVAADTLAAADVGGIILSGGPQSVSAAAPPCVDPKLCACGVPVLGICYGHQLIARLCGGTVVAGNAREYGRATMRIMGASPLLEGVPSPTVVWMSHGDSVKRLPEGFVTIGTTADCAITAMANEKRRIYGLQFHPEVDHSRDGARIVENFAVRICDMPRTWKTDTIIADVTRKIRAQVGDKNVFLLMSGGVDSNVAFALLTAALGKARVRGLMIDTGFMRAGEVEEVVRTFREAGMDTITVRDAADAFFAATAGVIAPEEKRRRVGQTFVDVKDAALAEMRLRSDEWFLGQGTIYPDIIESGGTARADTIKTHHNRVDAIKDMIAAGRVVEPLADFYKHEVRAIGRALGLPDILVDRHPFPGPGLAIRVLNTDPARHAKGAPSVAAATDCANRLFDARFANIARAVLPVKSVGVQGDGRTYAYPLAIWGETDWETVDAISVATTNACPDINRVVLLLTSAARPVFLPPRTARTLTRQRVEVLRAVDAIVTRHMRRTGLDKEILQFPVVLVPITDGSDKESIVLRPIHTRDFMTAAFYRMDAEVLAKLVDAIVATGMISHVFYDVTNKPPGTTEWE